MDPAWAESGGNRYLLHLFRDYVYHQVDEEGRPVLDLGHIVHSLNRVGTMYNEHGAPEGLPPLCPWLALLLLLFIISSVSLTPFTTAAPPQLDVGDPEKIMLMSRDAQTMLIVS